MTSLHQKFFRSGLLVACAIALGQAALAADQVIPAFRKVQISAPTTFDTRQFDPQILPGKSLKPVSPNETPRRPSIKGVPNGLVAGKNSQDPRGYLPKITFSGIGFTGSVPPDCDVAVGPSHVVAVVNTTIAFFTKTGTKTLQQEMSTSGFFSGNPSAASFYSDPKVFYDKASGRWFVLILGLDFGTAQVGDILLAVSDDSDPNGVWKQYAIDNTYTDASSNKVWLDYPGFGMSSDSIVFTGNMFGFSAGGGDVQFLVLPKSKILAGQAVTATSFKDPDARTVQMTRSWEGATTVFGIADGNTTTNLDLFAITNGSTTPVLTKTSIAVPEKLRFSGDVPSTGGAVLDGFDARLFTAHYRAGTLTAAHGVAVSSSENRQMARWYEVKVNSWPTAGTPTLVQSGNIVGASNEHIHMPAVNKNKPGDLVVLATRSGPSVAADLVYYARKKSDAPGKVGAPVIVKQSIGSSYLGFRWGDYFQVAIDPNDESTFWVFGMTIDSSNLWETWVSNFLVSSPGGDLAVTPTSIARYQGGTLVGDASSVASSDNAYASIPTVAQRGYGQVSGITANFKVTKAGVDSLNLRLESKGAVGATGIIYAYNQVTKAYDVIQSYPLTATDKAVTVNIPNAKNYVSATRDIKILVRGVVPNRAGQSTPFRLFLDHLRLSVGFGS